MQRHGMAAVFRLIPEEIKTIKELDLPEQLARLIDVSEGLVLVTAHHLTSNRDGNADRKAARHDHL